MINGKRVIALLPMKANSERVKGKNFKAFAGKPLFRWILDSLLSVDYIDQIVINTDARELLGKSGLISSGRVEIRDRKIEICGDLVSMNAVLADDVENVPADIYFMTHTTNPLLSVKTIRSALEKFSEVGLLGVADSLFSVNKVQTRFYGEDGKPINHDPSNLIPTQHLEPWFEENSNFYIFTGDSFAMTGARIGRLPLMYEVSKFESIDIDTPDDWNFAVVAAQYFKENEVEKI